MGPRQLLQDLGVRKRHPEMLVDQVAGVAWVGLVDSGSVSQAGGSVH